MKERDRVTLSNLQLKAELSEAGLETYPTCLDDPVGWAGVVDRRPFLMYLPPARDEDGMRKYMFFSFFGQDEQKMLPLLTKFMGYPPCFKYKWNNCPDISATYEWSKNPEEALKEIGKRPEIKDIQLLEENIPTT